MAQPRSTRVLTEARVNELIAYALRTRLAGAGGAGVTDHGTLSGLTDDDHPQYALADKSRPSPWVAAADLAARSIADLGTRDHDLLTGLLDDDHTQYMLGAGVVVDNRIPRFVGTGGRTVENTDLEITDAGDLVMSNGGLHKIHFDAVVNDTFLFASATKQLDIVCGGSIMAVFNGDVAAGGNLITLNKITEITPTLRVSDIDDVVTIDGVESGGLPMAITAHSNSGLDGSGQNLDLKAGNSGASGASSGVVNITSGSAIVPSARGGNIVVTTGAGAGANQTSGSVLIQVGTPGNSAGNTAEIRAGAGNGTNRAGGNVIVTGGLATGTAKGGSVQLTPGVSSTGEPGNVNMSTTTAALVPVGTTAQRPAAASNGHFRYNSSDHAFEGHENAAWVQLVTHAKAMSRVSLGF